MELIVANSEVKSYILEGDPQGEHSFVRREGKEVVIGLVFDTSVGTNLPPSLQTREYWRGPVFQFSRAWTELFDDNKLSNGHS